MQTSQTSTTPPQTARSSTTTSTTDARSSESEATPSVQNDIDGDGQDDQVTVTTTSELRVRYAAGQTDTVWFDTSTPSRAELLGTWDADGDGRSEVFVRTETGASTEFATAFRYVGGHLQVITLDGEQTHLAYGGSVRHFDAWVAGWHETPIVTWSGTSDDGYAYPGVLRFYSFRGTTLVQSGSQPYTFTHDNLPPHAGAFSR